METEKSEKKEVKSMGFTLKIKESKKKEVKKNSLFDAKNFRKPFEEDVVYNDDIKVKEELIKEVEGKKIHAVHEIEEKGPLVIPLIKTNQWRNQDELKKIQDNNNNNIKVDKDDDDKEINKGDQQDEKVKDKKENEKENEKEIDESNDGDDDKIDLKSKYGLQIPVKKRKLNSEDNNNTDLDTKNKNVVDDNDNKIKEEDNKTIEEKAISALMKEAQMDVDDLGNDSITKSSIDAIPILKQNAVPGAENLMTETEKFRHDIKYRPEESTLEDYERIPIEEFGAAMLRGMGWEKGKGVGKNRNKNKNTMVSPIEFIPRPALLGLGAQPKPPDLEEMKKRRKRKMMGKEEIPKEYKPNITSDGKVRHFKTIDESINNNKNNNNNSINSRSHSHSRDHSHDRNRSHSRHHSSSHNNDHDHERERNHHRHSSHRSDKDKGGNESDSSLSSSSSSSSSLNKKESKSYTHSSSSSYTHNQKHNHDHRSHSRHHSHHDHDEDVNYNTKSKNNNNKSRKYNNNSWLYPNIRVRIVSKSFKSGKYYKKKGVIFDVNQQGECILRLDNGKLLENVKERYLETLIPEINEIIMVVKHTNNYTDEDYYQKLGKVLSKDRETEKAMIQLEPSMDVVLLSFDDICEYKGNTNDFY